MISTNNILKNRANILRGHEVFAAHIQDQIYSVIRYRCPAVTSFLTPTEQEIVKQLVKNQLFLSFYGGYDQAVRKLAFISFEPMEPDFDYSILSSSYSYDRRRLSHRDVLGALMNLGLERNQIGDICVSDHEIALVCKQPISEWIQNELRYVAHSPVAFEENYSFVWNTQVLETITINVSSFRMDSIVASLANVSRSKAMKMIDQGNVKLNDVILEDNEQLCHNDYVSIRGIGRFHCLGVLSKTKKDRWILSFEKYK